MDVIPHEANRALVGSDVGSDRGCNPNTLLISASRIKKILMSLYKYKLEYLTKSIKKLSFSKVSQASGMGEHVYQRCFKKTAAAVFSVAVTPNTIASGCSPQIRKERSEVIILTCHARQAHF